MSRTNMAISDIPKYINDMLPRLYLSTTKEYVWILYGKHKCGYESQLESEADKLVGFAKRFYADAEIVSTCFWNDICPPKAGESWKTARARAYRQGVRNFIEIRITDPVSRVFEIALQYKKEEK